MVYFVVTIVTESYFSFFISTHKYFTLTVIADFCNRFLL